MNRLPFRALAGAIIAISAFAAGSIAGPNLPPAPYKPPPSGKVLDYGDWKCKVEDAKGFRHACVDGRQRAEFFARFIHVGKPDADGYAATLPEIWCPGLSSRRWA